MEKFKQRLEKYNERYGFEVNRNDFSYNNSPEQIVYRNEALRTGNRKLYEDYLEERYPLNKEIELKAFDNILPKIMKLDRAAFLSWSVDKGITLVESDISIFEEDAILMGIRLEDEEKEKYEIAESWDELIHNIHIPTDLAKEREYFWIIDE